MKRSLLLSLVGLLIMVSMGCASPLGVTKHDAKYMRELVDRQAKVGLANVTVLHTGNASSVMDYGPQTTQSAEYILNAKSDFSSLSASVFWLTNLTDDNKPTEAQVKNMRQLDGKVVAKLKERLPNEIVPLMDFEKLQPTVNDEKGKQVVSFVRNNQLSIALNVTFYLGHKDVTMFKRQAAVYGHWDLIDPSGNTRLSIKTVNILPDEVHVKDTRDLENQRYYEDAINEAVTDFAIHLYEALSPESVPTFE
ncbi:hypothetical protein JD969_06055 [Planctomycetota bacterium]|nr:hypothetical protein JD969_06055 [Planctomycetota bacterium]